MPSAKASMPPSVTKDPCGVGKFGLRIPRIFFWQAPSKRVQARRGSMARLMRRGLYNCLFILFHALSDQLESDVQRKLIGPKVWRAIKVDAGESPCPAVRKVVALLVVGSGIFRIETAIFGKGQQVAAGSSDGEPFDGFGAGYIP